MHRIVRETARRDLAQCWIIFLVNRERESK
jgi:hypothetical protein